MNNEKMNPNELCDEMLDAVSGGAIDTERYRINDIETFLYNCPGCGKINPKGVLIGFAIEKRDGGVKKLRYRMECCETVIEIGEV